MSRVQLPPAQSVRGRYLEGVQVTHVKLAGSETDHPVYDHPTAGSAVTYPLTSGPEGKIGAYAEPATVDVYFDAEDDVIDNPQRVELISGFDSSVALGIISDGLAGLPFVNVMDFGAVHDGVTDDLPAIQAAIESFSDGSNANWKWPGGIVWFPGASDGADGVEYRISGPIIVNRVGTTLRGPGRGRNGSGPVRIRPDDGQSAVIIHHPNGYPVDPEDNTKRGDHACIEGLNFRPYGNTVPDIDGIKVRYNCWIKDCDIGGGTLNGFSGNGISIDANYTQPSNANLWYIERTRCEGNLKNGLYVNNNDSNAGLCLLGDMSYNGEWGFWESSDLGNTYIACHTQGNGQVDGTSGGYKTGPSMVAQNVFIGCYAEGGQGGPNNIGEKALVIGGIGVSDTDNNIGNCVMLTGTRSNVVQNTQGGFLASRAGTGTVELGGNDAILEFNTVPGESSSAWKMVYDTDDEEIQWRLGGAGSVGTTGALSFTMADSERGEGYVRVNQGLIFGSPGGTVIKKAAAAPTTGTWKLGDIIQNSAPSAGEPVGWICVAAGTPGTWQHYGNIAGSASGYTAANSTVDRSYDVNTATTQELGNVLATLITDLIAKGSL